MLYIGTKIVHLTPMNRAAYNDYRGWQLPADENGTDEGYLVEYTDGGKPNVAGHAGYVSWSPKEQADRTYRKCSQMSFGFAMEALRAGHRIARAGWNGKGMFAYLVPGNSYPAQTGAAKAFFGEHGMVPYNAYMALKGADNTVSTWAPSGSDALADDWLVVESVASTRPPHQQRVVDEQAELGVRLAGLYAFFDNPIFTTLHDDEQRRLFAQAQAMQAYSDILAARIAAF